MSSREPFRALVTVLAVVALVFAAGLLPAFGGAAPASEVAAELPGVGGEAPSDAPSSPQSPQQAPGDSDSLFSFSLDGFDLSGADGWGSPPDSGILDGLLDLFSVTGGGGQVANGSQQQDDRSESGDGSDPDKQKQAGEGESGEQSDPSDSERCRPANDPYVVCFEERLVPGTETTLLILDGDGDPATGVGVRVNGEPAGTTDDRGSVRVEVPYAEQMVVTVETGGASSTAAFYAVSAAEDGASMAVETEVTIEFASEPAPGEAVTFRATVADRPLDDAAVLVDGEERTRTDGSGVATVTMPRATDAKLTVTRGDLQGERELTLAAPAIDVDGEGAFGVALPGQPATLVVTESGDPVAGAEVRVDGEPVGTTDADGRVNATLPTAPTATVGATLPSGVTYERTAYIGLVPAILGVFGLFVVVGLALIARRTDASDAQELGAGVVETARAFARGVLDRVVGIAATVEAIAGAIREAVHSLWAALRSKDPVGALRALFAQFRRRVRMVGASTVERVTTVASRASDDDERTVGETAGSRPAIERAWWSLVSLVDLRRVSNRTPGDVARKAKAAGFPSGPVDRLTEAFRAVKYGGRDPEQYADEASRAAAELDEGETE